MVDLEIFGSALMLPALDPSQPARGLMQSQLALEAAFWLLFTDCQSVFQRALTTSALTSKGYGLQILQ